MMVMDRVGERIRSKRKELGLSQTELARRARISKAYLSALEKDAVGVGAVILARIAAALNVSLDGLMDTTPEIRALELPPVLIRHAAEIEMPIRHALAIHGMALVIREYRSRDRPLDLSGFDWAKFYLAVKEFL